MAGRPLPEWLALVARELTPPKDRETACFAMFCYWEGDKALGALDGIVATRIGSLAGREAIEVDYDPGVTPFAALLAAAKGGCRDLALFARTEAQEAAALAAGLPVSKPTGSLVLHTPQKKHLSLQPDLYYLPLTEAQAVRLNAALAAKQDPTRWLAPFQGALRKHLGEALSKRKAATLEALAALPSLRDPRKIAQAVDAFEKGIGSGNRK